MELRNSPFFYIAKQTIFFGDNPKFSFSIISLSTKSYRLLPKFPKSAASSLYKTLSIIFS